ncbi:MAG: hypothetical protein JST40_05800 [Armatimonadetes bacterium]|nr:hypothetical protein [Armatimonadota bacterium]
MRHLQFFCLLTACGIAHAQSVGPSPYLKAADSPWNSLTWSYHYLEDFEDGLLNVPGVTKDQGNVYGPAFNTDSVDADDGTIDGFGIDGHSFFHVSGPEGITFTFDAGILGSLPTRAGLVWTDGTDDITFEAWDQNGVSLGKVNGYHADGSTLGTTGDDRFYGWVNADGISKMKITNSGGGIEVDHLQYGISTVPEPFSASVLCAGMIGLLRRKRIGAR